MVQINFAQKQISAKVVYYGPGMSGKTTNLEVVHQRAPEQNRGDLTSISTDGDRTLFFDFMPLDLGTVAGMRTCFQIYTVPGQVYYNSTRKLVLQGVDGVVFVADSSATMLQENLESLRNLEENLNEYGKSLASMPHVIQFNKRDLPDAMSCDELNAHLNTHGAPFFEAIANTGQGVFPTLKALASRVLEAIHAGSAGGGPNAARPAPAPAQQPRAPMPMQPPAPAPMPITRGAQPAQQVAAFAGAPAQRTGFQAPQPPSPVQQGYQGQQMQQSAPQMMQPPQMGMQSIQMQQPQMHQQSMPMQQQPQLVQSGFHQQAQAAPVQQQYAQPAPQPQAQASSLQLQSPRAGGAAPSAHSPASAGRAGASPARSGPAPAPKPRPAQSALDGTRFRPRGTPATPRAEPRATPVAKGGTKLYMAMFITAALVVGAGVTYAIVSFF